MELCLLVTPVMAAVSGTSGAASVKSCSAPSSQALGGISAHLLLDFHILKILLPMVDLLLNVQK